MMKYIDVSYLILCNQGRNRGGGTTVMELKPPLARPQLRKKINSFNF